MELALILPTQPDPLWDLAKQMGVTRAVTRLPSATGNRDPWDYEPLLGMKTGLNDAGLELAVIEGRPPMDEILLGGDGRDRQIEYVQTLLRNMGRLDVPVWCSSWVVRMDGQLGVLRTSRSVPARGGSLVTGYDHGLMRNAPDLGEVTEEELWDNLEYYLERVGPVAEEAGVKMALHPNDPPLSEPIRGVSRIINSVEAYDRVLDIYPSEYNGICLCQGNFSAMGVDIPETIRHFGDDIHFVHFRDVRGTAGEFVETWHDDGQTDMLAAMRAYRDVGFDGVMRPDHFPDVTATDGDGHNKGRLFAVGYMTGLMEQARDER